MKKILITGKNSYVGTSLMSWLRNYPEQYYVDSISLKDEKWRIEEFSKYDVVIHVAGIAHIKETEKNRELYYKINRDLAFEVAQKAKFEEVKQFIFLSSMSVYGIENGGIDKHSTLNPRSNYGISKLQAEELIKTIQDGIFKVAIIRPPMIYGKGCKGNYIRLASLAIKTPIFPNINNKRSMIYIDNLSEFIKILIDDNASGTFCPQNNEYVNTSELVMQISKSHGKKLILTKVFNSLLGLVKINTVNKVFGDLFYEKSVSKYSKDYNVKDFKDSIKLTEGMECNLNVGKEL